MHWTVYLCQESMVEKSGRDDQDLTIKPERQSISRLSAMMALGSIALIWCDTPFKNALLRHTLRRGAMC